MATLYCTWSDSSLHCTWSDSWATPCHRRDSPATHCRPLLFFARQLPFPPQWQTDRLTALQNQFRIAKARESSPVSRESTSRGNHRPAPATSSHQRFQSDQNMTFVRSTISSLWSKWANAIHTSDMPWACPSTHPPPNPSIISPLLPPRRGRSFLEGLGGV